MNKIYTIFLCTIILDKSPYEKRIENIVKGKSYLRSNGFFKSKSNLFEDIKKFIYKK